MPSCLMLSLLRSRSASSAVSQVRIICVGAFEDSIAAMNFSAASGVRLSGSGKLMTWLPIPKVNGAGAAAFSSFARALNVNVGCACQTCVISLFVWRLVTC